MREAGTKETKTQTVLTVCVFVISRGKRRLLDF